MKIYTKTGDKGMSSLVGGQRVSKDDLRLEAYGTADELNSFLGLLRAKMTTLHCIELIDYVHFIQNKLFNLSAVLASEEPEKELGKDLQLKESDVKTLEEWIDKMQENLPIIHSFILPAGTETVSLCHVCRTIARRLERRMVSLCKVSAIGQINMQFVNRLSDFLFILSKKVAFLEKSEIFLWEK